MSDTAHSSTTGGQAVPSAPAPLYACLFEPPVANQPAGDGSMLTALAGDFSPRFERHRDDLVSIDIRGLDRLLGHPQAIGLELRRSAGARGLHLDLGHVGVYRALGYAQDVALAEDRVYVADRFNGLQVLDVHNPARPRHEVGQGNTFRLFRATFAV